MDISLSLATPDLRQSELQGLTRKLCTSLKQDPQIEAQIQEEPGGEGKKGDIVTIGSIVLSLIGGGGVVVSLINVLKSYVDRVPSWVYSFSESAG